MEKLCMESSMEETTKVGIKRIETQEIPTSLDNACSKRIKPRAIVFKANDKDLKKIKELIETQFPKVEIIYVTTGPAASILCVTKSIPIELQNSLSRNRFKVLSNTKFVEFLILNFFSRHLQLLKIAFLLNSSG